MRDRQEELRQCCIHLMVAIDKNFSAFDITNAEALAIAATLSYEVIQSSVPEHYQVRKKRIAESATMFIRLLGKHIEDNQGIKVNIDVESKGLSFDKE